MNETPLTDQDAMWDAYHQFHYRCDTERFQKLFARMELVRMVSTLPGDIVDAGVFKGISTIQFAHLLKTFRPNSRAKVIAFDTFERKFPHARNYEQTAVDSHEKIFDEEAYQRLTDSLSVVGIENRVELVVGDVLSTFPGYLEKNPGFRICLLHLDFDIYRPTIETLKHAWMRVVPGGIVAFDEYAVGGWGESDAVDEFLSTLDKPPSLKTLPLSPAPTAYLIKT